MKVVDWSGLSCRGSLSLATNPCSEIQWTVNNTETLGSLCGIPEKKLLVTLMLFLMKVITVR